MVTCRGINAGSNMKTGPLKLFHPADNRPVFLLFIDLILLSHSPTGFVNWGMVCSQPFDLIGCDEGLALEKPFCQS